MIKKLSLLLIIIVSNCSYAQTLFQTYQSLPTSGARDVTPFTINGKHYLAIPQLAKDIPDTKANMNGGNADVPVLIYRWSHGKFIPYQQIPGHGNEATEFFQIGKKAYLAVASIHSGPKPPYNFLTYSKLYRFDGERFYAVQQFYGYATKSVKHFQIGEHHFLAFGNGAIPPDGKPLGDTNSKIYQYDGKRFIPFQTIKSSWAYQWEFFTVGNEHYLALADHITASTLYRWDGKQFQPLQIFEQTGGRAFTHFSIDKQDYLAFANITHQPSLYQFDGKTFKPYQQFDGLGSRNFVYFNQDGKHYLQRINFITGSRTNPQTEQQSPLYQWQQGKFVKIETITTFGGVNAAHFCINKNCYLAVANSLSKAIRFNTPSQIYKLN